MAETDTRLLQPADLCVAVMLLTRLPVPGRWPLRGARASWAFPLAGLAAVAPAVVLGAVALALGLPATVAAGLVLGVQMIATGALHEDGLADVADGFWGGYGPARRLEIMRDSRIGTYGVAALVLSLGLRWATLAALIESGGWGWAVCAVAALSRAAMPVMMRELPNARGEGLSAAVGAPPRATVAVGLLLALGLGFAALGPMVLAVGVLMALVAVGVAALARAKIGGQTGDVLGATQQLCEIAGLVSLCAFL